ncbi:MAG: hypothetical protein VB089_21115 [Anaerolineaceae bacterium]|nr:hypothetical protein [Anaerolineaceae bacterium]
MSTRKPVILWLVSVLLIGAVLSGCAAPATPQPTSTPEVVKVVPSNTPSPAPTNTRTVTQTLPPTASPTATVTPTPKPLDDFSQASFFTSGHLPDYRYFIAIELPDPIQGQYYAWVDDNREYPCEPNGEYPNRLYCTGALAGVDKTIDYSIREKDSDREVFSGDVYITNPFGW